MNKKQLAKAVGMLLAGFVLLGYSAYALNAVLTVHNTGSMGVVGIYFDPECKQPMTTIAWNTTVPDNAFDVRAWLKNFGSSDVNVTMTPSNWSPINASQYMTVTWDHQGAILHPGVEEALITLFVYANASSSGISSYSFDININEAW